MMKFCGHIFSWFAVILGLDFLTVLGAHEGEGLVVAADAEVAGSRSPWIADNGQRVRPARRCLPAAQHACSSASPTATAQMIGIPKGTH